MWVQFEGGKCGELTWATVTYKTFFAESRLGKNIIRTFYKSIALK